LRRKAATPNKAQPTRETVEPLSGTGTPSTKPGARTHIVDLATGSGDIPRLIADYARKLDAQVEVDAFDQQSATLEIATTLSADYPEISYREADILEWHSVETYDVVLCLARDRMSTASSAVNEQ
jgi:2-polyprenyl-3-methyl-5-hydroxy-6-metoxy-1,4-benzoquinol methylase